MATTIKGTPTNAANEAVVLNGSAKLPAVDGSLLTNVAAATATSLSTASGSAPSYSARAWVCFNGTGTPAVIASGNVSSITDVNTGRWTVNITTALPTTMYSVVDSSSSTTNTAPTANYGNSSLLPNNTTTSFSFVCITGAGTYLDSENMSAAVFR